MLFQSATRQFLSKRFIFQRKFVTIGDDAINKHNVARDSKTSQKINKFLNDKATSVNFDEYINSKTLNESCPIKAVYVNQLAANSIMEDRWNIGLVQVEGIASSFVFTVLDGHSGSACAHLLAWAALDYIGAACLDSEKLSAVLQHWRLHGCQQPYHIARRLSLSHQTGRIGHAAQPPGPRLKEDFHQRLHRFVQELQSRGPHSRVDAGAAISEALLRLDEEICSVGFENQAAFNCYPKDPFAEEMPRDLLHPAISGAVGIFGHIIWHGASGLSAPLARCSGDETKVHLSLANVGDCAAVLLSRPEPSSPGLVARCLHSVHQAGVNAQEALRLATEHPQDPVEMLVRNEGRLLGELAPCRAFGDVRYKWPSHRLLQLAEHFAAETPVHSSSQVPMGPWAGLPALPTPYNNPPYLTARPDVTTIEVGPLDRYLVVATDGLWDVVSPEDTAKILANLETDQSPATGLVRASLTSASPEAARLLLRGSKRGLPIRDPEGLRLAAALLSLPAGVARYYRDDITVMVIELSTAGSHV